MIDIHCHILHGVDDGAKSLDESVAMARIAYEDGVRHIFATPHFTDSMFNHRELVVRKVQELNSVLEAEKIGVKVHASNEVRLESAEFVYFHGKETNFCYLGSGERFILLEQRWHEYNKNTPEVIKWFLDKGVQPIIPHPERHFFFREQEGLLDSLIETGAWTQVTVDSIIGNNGPEAQQFAHTLVRTGKAHTIASDAHDAGNRTIRLTVGFEAYERLAGAEAAEALRRRMEQFV